MAFFEAVAICFLKYAVFSGRASRSEYWNFVLFLVIALIGVGALDSVLFDGQVSGAINGFQVKTIGPFSTLFLLAVLCPTVAAGWRRMHDTGRSGLHLLYPVIVVVGVSMYFAFMAGFVPQLIPAA